MGYLKNAKCYLSGAIDADMSGKNWRPAVIETLSSRFGVNVFDPFSDPKQMKGKEMAEAKAAGNFDKVREIVLGFVAKDLSEIDRTDMLIARIGMHSIYYANQIKDTDIWQDDFGQMRLMLPPPSVTPIPTTGTVHEIVNADLYKKPTMLVCEEGVKHIPGWYFGILKPEYMFGSWESLYNYLQEVADGKHMNNKRWQRVYGLI